MVLSWLLEAFGLIRFNPILDNPLTDSLGLPGQVVRTVLVLEGVLALLLLLALIPAAIPLGILFRDLRRTFGRYQILMPKTPGQIGDAPYLEAAKQVFEQDPSVAVFVYGHTHLASLKEVDGRVVVNTGTWLKMPKKVPVLFGQLAAGLHPGVPPELLQDGRRRWPPGDLLRTHRKETTLRADLGAASPDVDQAPARGGDHPEEDRRRRVKAAKTKVLR